MPSLRRIWKEGFYNAQNNTWSYIYNFKETDVYSLQLVFRYAFGNIRTLKWKHYAGITMAYHRNIEGTYGFSDAYHPDKIEYTYYTPSYSYAGLEYFSKIELNKRLSVQYLFGYTASILYLDDLAVASNEQLTTHRFNMNFGFGYQL